MNNAINIDKAQIRKEILELVARGKFYGHRYIAGVSTREISDCFVWDKGGRNLAQHFETRTQASNWFRWAVLEEMRLGALISQSGDTGEWFLFDPRYDSAYKRHNG